MEFGLKGTSRVSRGRHGGVGIVEFGLNRRRRLRLAGDRGVAGGRSEIKPGGRAGGRARWQGTTRGGRGRTTQSHVASEPMKL